MSKASQVVIVGGGIMGGDIASVFAAKNWQVHVMSPSQKTRDALGPRLTAGLQKIHADAVQVAGTADMRSRIDGLGATLIANSPEQFRAQIRNDLAKWARIIKQSGAKPE